MTVKVFAPAKINLTLHVTGQRSDGFHLLDSLVAFAGVGDMLTLNPGTSDAFAVTGPEAKGVPVDASNLVQQVVSRFWTGPSLRIDLEKNLPAAAGIGGGSADAAACFRGISYLMDQGNPDYSIDMLAGSTMQDLVEIGADTPMCVLSKPARIRGIGEKIELLGDIPQLGIVMVNPRVPMPTPSVFAALKNRENPPMPPMPQDLSDALAFVDWLAAQRNDLEPAAISLKPEIGEILTQIRQTEGCLLARMSGSGATCFGLYETRSAAAYAAMEIEEYDVDWWVRPTTLIGDELVRPQLIRATT